ncbi:DUF5687 family protein, partial [Bacteroidales bacterium OttesenSCG-928-I14]|nr:DUF5687 family protein [Bacteroidales bacterium OttesenSCG-928-I14]
MSELGKHRKKAFLRNPMFGLNLGVRIFMILIFGMLASEMLVFGFVLDKLLLEVGEYTRAIDTFNSILVYIFLLDFLLKFFIKRNNSMRIMPYLTLPIPRKKLFDFLLKKEFYSFWNLYLLFLVVPFSFMAIAPFHGILLTFAYIIFFYSICIGNSLLVNFINNLIGRKWWTKLIAAIIVAGIVFLGFDPQINYGDWTVSIGDAFFKWNPLVWLIQLGIVFGLWTLNRKQMRNAVYSELQGNKKDKISKITGFSFFDRFGEIGEFMNLDIKMIFRSKRLRQQIYTGVFFVIFYFIIVYSGENNPILHSFFYKLFFMLFCLGYLGLIMGQYLFTSESSFFDGLMARNKSLMPMLMGKYFLYVGYATVTLPILAIPAFHDKYSFLFL